MNKCIKIFFAYGNILIIFYLRIVLVTTEDIRDLSIAGLSDLFIDVTEIRPDDVNIDDISFYLFSRDISNKKLNVNDKINLDKGTKFIIHGWIETARRSWCQKLTEEFLINGDYNVIKVDWERVARSSYFSSARNTRFVGNIIGDFIISMKFSLDNLHLIGHSLGSHVAGFAAKRVYKKTGNKIDRITALDPAGPFFRNIFITQNDRLNIGDADFIEVFHTDDGFFGYKQPLGNIDIYFNGGSRPQPGCIDFSELESIGKAIEKGFCSHARSWKYYTESINTGTIVCKRCHSWDDFVNEECPDKEPFIISGGSVPKEMTGICFVKTNFEIPFLKTK